MRILGIETSCDETAVAIVDDGTRVLSNIIATSKDAFETSGGVIPELAARRQVECMIPVLTKALLSAHTSPKEIDAIAVTKGPGLLGSLLVGTVTARTLASVWKKPLVGVHHTLGHLSSIWLEQKSEIRSMKSETNPKNQKYKNEKLMQFPLLALSVSGGHTELWYRTSHTEGILLGQTRDDAAGEAFDKGASLLGLGYPGGPAIAKSAQGGDPDAYKFPLPLHDDDSLDFSFSGLKTALKYLFRDLNHPLVSSRVPRTLACHGELDESIHARVRGVSRDNSDIAASYQHAICLHLLDRLVKAAKHYPDIQEIHIVGGVSANAHLRSLAAQSLPHLLLRFPATLAYCTDNAAMIAAAGYFLIREKKQKAYEPFETQASMCL